MFILITAGIIFVISAALLARLILRRLPDLKNLDVTSLPEEIRGSTRTKILHAKWQRSSAATKGRWRQLIEPRRQQWSRRLRRFHEQVAELEQRYHGTLATQTEPMTLDQLFSHARDLTEREEYGEAEKALIEILAREAKNTRAYEMLGDLYLATKNYHQAEEVFKYLLKLHLLGPQADDELASEVRKHGRFEELETEILSQLDVDPKIAVYYEDLAQVYQRLDKVDKAMDCFLKALAIEPNNPRYLDELIEISLKVKDYDLARKMYRRLKKINPENAKLEDFNDRIESGA